MKLAAHQKDKKSKNLSTIKLINGKSYHKKIEENQKLKAFIQIKQRRIKKYIKRILLKNFNQKYFHSKKMQVERESRVFY